MVYEWNKLSEKTVTGDYTDIEEILRGWAA